MVDLEDSRKLTAILAADVAGYSRLVQVDDRATVAALEHPEALFGTTMIVSRALLRLDYSAWRTILGRMLDPKCF